MKILFAKKVDINTISEQLGNDFFVDCMEFIKTENHNISPFEIKDKILIFTSVNGVYSFLENGFSLKGHLILVVGSKTQDAVISHFGKVEKTFAYASEMAKYIQSEQNKRYHLHFCGNLSLDILPQNEYYQKIISYQTHLLFPKIEKDYDAVVFFSPSGVKSFALHNSFENKHFFAIGNTTKQELQQYTNNITTSPTANLAGILTEILNSTK